MSLKFNQFFKMTKITELIDSIDFIEGFERTDIEYIMKRYAEIYARECLKIAEFEAGSFMGNSPTRPTQIILPKHK